MSDNSIKKLTYNTLIYTINGILMKCFSFFLLPLYTAYLSTSDYGIINLTKNFIVPMSFIVSFSLFSAISRFYVDFQHDAERLKKFYGTISIFVLCSSFFWAILLSITYQGLIKTIFSEIEFYPIVFITLITIIFESQYSIYILVLKSQQKALKSSIVSTTYFLLNISLNILLVIYFNYGVIGVLLSTLISNVVFCFIFIFDMYHNNLFEITIDFEILKSALMYSVPIMPHNLSTHIAVLISSALIGKINTYSSLGLYAVACQFGNIADTIQGYVDSAYGPWLYSKLASNEKDFKQSIGKAVEILGLCLGIAFLGISYFAQDYIYVFLNPTYHDAWILVPFIVTIFCIKTVYYFYVEILFYYKDASKKLFLCTLSSSIINIILSIYFIPLFGVYGAILSSLLSMFVRVGMVVYFSNKYSDIGLNLTIFIKNFFFIEIFIFVGMTYSLMFDITKFDISNFLYKLFFILLYSFLILQRFPIIKLMIINKFKYMFVSIAGGKHE